MYLAKVRSAESKIEGRGYFAEEFVPVGTIIYFYSKEDEFYSKESFDVLDSFKKDNLKEFAVEDEFGNWVLTKTGPYTNHSCDPNILPMFLNGKYFDIVVKDIAAGDEIAIDYSMFYSSTKWSMDCHCGSAKCRKKVGFGLDLDLSIENLYTELIKDAVSKINEVNQPIYDSNDENAKEITQMIKSIKKITVAKYIKYSLISSE